MFLGNDPVTDASVIPALDQLTGRQEDTTVFFRADKTVDYETMRKVMDTLHQAGYLKIGLSAKRKRPRSKTKAFAAFPAGGGVALPGLHSATIIVDSH